MEIKLTKKTGFSRNNIVICKKKKQKKKNYDEPWYILTSLSIIEEVLKVYAQRTGIEAIFKDCKSGGYN